MIVSIMTKQFILHVVLAKAESLDQPACQPCMMKVRAL